jgi:phosphoglycolate phosphatase-like HAD superfamily hydrolase
MPVNLKQRFDELRPYIRAGEDFLLIQHLLAAHIEVDNQRHFDYLAEQEGKERMASFRRRFYISRSRLLERDRGYWLSLNPLYPHMAEPLALLNENRYVHIVSTKKPAFIQEILKENGVPFPDGNIHFCPPKGKGVVCERLLTESNLDRGVLVEDQVEHLLAIKDAGIKGYLASWGYLKRGEAESVRNIELVTPAGMLSLFSELKRFNPHQ